MTSPWISTAAMIAMAVAKAAAAANKAMTMNKEGAGNYGGMGNVTPALPGLQQSSSMPHMGSMSNGMATNQNAFAPQIGPHGQWALNPFTISGGAGANMPDLGMDNPAVGPIGANLPPLQQEMTPIHTTPQPSLLDQGEMQRINPFGRERYPWETI